MWSMLQLLLIEKVLCDSSRVLLPLFVGEWLVGVVSLELLFSSFSSVCVV